MAKWEYLVERADIEDFHGPWVVKSGDETRLPPLLSERINELGSMGWELKIRESRLAAPRRIP